MPGRILFTDDTAQAIGDRKPRIRAEGVEREIVPIPTGCGLHRRRSDPFPAK